MAGDRDPIHAQASASGDLEFTRLSRDGSLPLPSSFVPGQNRNWGQGSLNLLSFGVDLWGRLRRSTEAARANLLNAEENRKAVITTLVSDVATDYFNLLQLDDELEISKRTLDTRRESRQGGGVATLLDLRQAEQLVSSAQTIPTLEQLLGRWHAEGAQLIANSKISRELAEAIIRQPLPDLAVAGNAIASRTWLPFRTSFTMPALVITLLVIQDRILRTEMVARSVVAQTGIEHAGPKTDRMTAPALME